MQIEHECWRWYLFLPFFPFRFPLLLCVWDVSASPAQEVLCERTRSLLLGLCPHSPQLPTPSAWPRTRPAKNRCLCKWTVDLSSLVMHSPFGRKSRKWVFGLISETSSLPFLHNLFDVWWGFEDLNLNIYKGMSEHIAVCKGTHSRLHEFF